jgi:predicted carbohydrate-binding protein with CBM5 and CBM33 domain
MKPVKFFAALVLGVALLGQVAVAQRGSGTKSASTTMIDASAVPANVMAAWNANFAGSTATKWNKTMVNDKVGYTAFYAKDGKVAKARFLEDGSYRWSAVHHNAKQVPAELATAANNATPGFTIRWAKAIYVASKKFSYYKVRQVKTGATLTSYFDTNLNPISKESVKSITPEAEADTEDEG